jgi:hypothetical protein
MIMSKESVQIGWFILNEPKEFTNHYEVAAWYQRILVPAGRYPVYGKFMYHEREKRFTNKIADTSISCRLDGIVTASDFSSLFAGNRIGSKIDEDKGEPSHTYLNPYAHALAEWILEGDSNYELTEEFEAREIPFVYNGKEQKTYGIFKK